MTNFPKSLRSFTVYRSSPSGKFAKKYPALKKVPVIFDGRPRIHRESYAFLVARALGHWNPDPRRGRVNGFIPSPISMLAYANHLANFLEWADTRSIDIQTCTYNVHLIGRYQAEMLSGLWSHDGKALSPVTVNLRVAQSCDFLHWLVETGRRTEPFVVPFDTISIFTGSGTSSAGYLGKEVQARRGKVRGTQSSLTLPPDEKVREWLERLRPKCGATIHLMCRTVLLTAMRREELVCLRKETLPENPKDWVTVNPSAPQAKQMVLLKIRYGTKGPVYGEDADDKIGPEREIKLPLTLAYEWHAYRQNERSFAFAKWMKGLKGQDAKSARTRMEHANKAVHLFLDEDDGARINARQFYDAWRRVELPIADWSPHKGRHWWACSVLWREMKKFERKDVEFRREDAQPLIKNSALDIIRLQIQPQLGHAHIATTMIYLRWVMNMLDYPVSLDEDSPELTEDLELIRK